MHTYTHIFIYIHTYIYTYTYNIYICICNHIYTYICIYDAQHLAYSSINNGTWTLLSDHMLQHDRSCSQGVCADKHGNGKSQMYIYLSFFPSICEVFQFSHCHFWLPKRFSIACLRYPAKKNPIVGWLNFPKLQRKLTHQLTNHQHQHMTLANVLWLNLILLVG